MQWRRLQGLVVMDSVEASFVRFQEKIAEIDKALDDLTDKAT